MTLAELGMAFWHDLAAPVIADDIEMSVEFTADSNSARQRETVTAPSLGAVEEISAGVYRSVLHQGARNVIPYQPVAGVQMSFHQLFLTEGE